ncbi:MAG: IS1 family transposase, partial [Chloroflexia bacterium]
NHPNCPYCGTNSRVLKAGLNGTGSQRMRCELCHRYFTPNPKPMGHDPKLKETAIRLYLEGMSFRGVGRVLGVNFQSVINWVNQAHEELPHKVEDQTPSESVELDELFTFVGKKRGKPTS